ncbi:hypothetical protein ACWGAN_07745 [Streptomyces sp. NPDC054945]
MDDIGSQVHHQGAQIRLGSAPDREAGPDRPLNCRLVGSGDDDGLAVEGASVGFGVDGHADGRHVAAGFGGRVRRPG